MIVVVIADVFISSGQLLGAFATAFKNIWKKIFN